MKKDSSEEENWTVVWRSKTMEGVIDCSPNRFTESRARYLASSMEALTNYPHRAMEVANE